nr:hypothetical protein [Neisseria dentiae]
MPHKAEAITTKPWKASELFHNFCRAWSAPEITTVSKPNRKPASATVIDQKRSLDWFIKRPFLLKVKRIASDKNCLKGQAVREKRF